MANFLSQVMIDNVRAYIKDDALTQIVNTLSNDVADIKERLENDKWINVKTYGAKGDGVTDDTAILQEIADGGYNMYFPKGEYYLSDTLEIGQSQMLLGSAEGAELVQHSTDPSSAVLAVGNRATIYALSLAYASDVPVETASQENHFVGLCLHSIKAPYNFQRTGIYKVRIYHVGNGITDWHPSLNAPSGIFSTGIHDCEIVNFSIAGLSLTGGSTGDHLDNVYITAGYTDGGTADAKLREARYGVHIKGNRALNVTNVNIEWGIFGYNPFMAEGSCIIGDSLHFEEVGLKGSYRGVINLINSDMKLASVAFNFPWLYTNGTKLFTLGNGGIANPYNSDPDRGSKRSEVEIGTLLLNGLNNPAYQVFPSAYFTEKGLTYAPNWGLINREANVQGEYGFKVDNYTYNCPYADDLAAYEDPPRNPHSTIDIVKLGNIKEYGVYADRPTKRLCRYHTRYVASNMNYGEYLFIGYHTDGANADNWIRISDGPQWREVTVEKGEIFQNAQVLTASYNEYRGLLKLHLQGTPSATSGTLGVVQGINRGGKVAFPYGNGVYVLTLAGDGTLTLTNPLNSPPMAWTHMSILMPLN